MKQACEASLQRLGVDVIDLYYQHRVDPIGADRGHRRRHGAGWWSRARCASSACRKRKPETIRRAHAVHPIAAVQTEYSLLYRKEAEETRQTTRELGIGFVAYSPLGRGLLTGAIQTLADIDGRRAAHPRFQAENFDAQPRAGRARRGAGRATKGCTPAQVTLAWLLAQGDDVVAIPGTRYRGAARREPRRARCAR